MDITKSMTEKILKEIAEDQKYVRENRNELIGKMGILTIINEKKIPCIIDSISEEGCIRFKATCEIEFKDTGEKIRGYLFIGYSMKNFKMN